MAKRVILKNALPGIKSKRIIERERKFIATGTKCWETPAVPEKGEGVWFTDLDGNVMMDWTNGMVAILGHSHPGWIKANIEQLQKIVYFNSPDFPNPKQAELIEELVKLTPGNFPKKVFLSCSGTEAVEAALKVARISTGKNIVIGWIGDFHGRTAGSLALTASKPAQKSGYTQYLTSTFSIPFANCYRCWYGMVYPSCGAFCAEVLERHFKTHIPPEDVAAIIYEPVQGEGGYIVPPKEFYQKLQKITKKYKILLIADEVQTGFGKSGYWFASEAFGMTPDIVTIAKGIGNGAPMGATVFPAKLDFPRQGMHSNTFGGQLLSCASALATIDAIKKEKLLARAKKMGEIFRNKLLALQEKFKSIGDVRNLGLLIGVEFVKDRKSKEPAKELRDNLIKRCYERGLLIIPCGESTIRITPPLTIREDEISTGIEILEKALKDVKA
ncbi:MAG: aminotransferase class III-fold pyridoxal phosphate-dependent enzyme [Firmicutes bacterium]|nr:aminotransferase class III-fold pyridoxal phosphate-dependent enzyme [Bacillota bacterium]